MLKLKSSRVFAWVVRSVLGVVTAGVVWTLAFYGSVSPVLQLEPGDVAPRDFVASVPFDVVDVTETEVRRASARAGVPAPYYSDLEAEAELRTDLLAFFDRLAQTPIAEPPVFTPSSPPAVSEGSSTTLVEDTEVELVGFVFFDVDSDSFFSEGSDHPASGLAVEVVSPSGSRTVPTRSDGSFSALVEPGTLLVRLPVSGSGIPAGFAPTEESFEVEVSCSSRSCRTPNLVLAPNLVDLEAAASRLAKEFGLSEASAVTLVNLAASDVLRRPSGGPAHLSAVRQATLVRLNELFGQMVTPDQEETVRNRQRTSPPVVFLPGSPDPDPDVSAAAGDVLAAFFHATYLVDYEAWEADQEAAAAAVADVVVSYAAGEVIALEGQRLTRLQVDAITVSASQDPSHTAPVPLAVLCVALVGFFGLYTRRLRPEVWGRLRLLALASTLVVLFAGSVFLTVRLSPVAGWFLIPAAAFGLVSVVLFDARFAALLAVGYAFCTLLLTLSAPATGFVLLSALVPIPLVSAASTRKHFRTASLLAAAASAVLASALVWLFSDEGSSAWGFLPEAAAWSFGGALFSCLVGLAALQFFEQIFDVTTTLRLLDLTDRNHEALLLLQEKAFGTFNHSLMVGTLAHAAAQAVDANTLLARAMAYYHDLGKTENPGFFIENQAGASNPHDQLSPAESAEVLRRHVSDGLVLAKRFGIPSAVAEGIRRHHGDSVMRFFHAKAVEEAASRGEPAPAEDAFRHLGSKPNSKETAIVMLADAVEAASRATFSHTDPSPAAIEELVSRIVDEKVSDGQLSEAPITLGELERIRSAFCEALAGHYHQRIPYPNFPGSSEAA